MSVTVRNVNEFSDRAKLNQRHLRENKAIAVEPVRVLGVEPHEVLPQDVCNRCHTPCVSSVLGSLVSKRAVRGVQPKRRRTGFGWTHMGAPGWPELLLATASAYRRSSQHSVEGRGWQGKGRWVVNCRSWAQGEALEGQWRGNAPTVKNVQYARGTHREDADGVDGQLIRLVVTHGEV